MTDNLKTDREIANALPLTWPFFFTRFGRLKQAQREVIKPLLEGKNLLVCAPTASGKTEAVCAPLLESNLNGHSKDWKLLYIVPTRALCNDIYYRLKMPCSYLGISIARRTGEYKSSANEAKLIITTPESFDSLLCREKLPDPLGHLLASATGIIIDEIHLLYGNARGEQLRWLIQRLISLRSFAYKKGWSQNDNLQIVGLSATLPDADAVSKFFWISGPIIQVKGQRNLLNIPINCEFPKTEQVLPSYLASLKTPEKVLIFCNSRKRVEVLFANLKDEIEKYGYQAELHHGSIPKENREKTEDVLRRYEKLVVFSTSTLEIGIDIGNIDIVILDAPAPDISALLQRIGRGNRRTEETRLIACANNLAEVIIQSAMVESAKNCSFYSSVPGKNYSVINQQIASYIFQSGKGRRRRDKIVDLLHKNVPELNADELIDYFISTGLFVQREHSIQLGEDWQANTDNWHIHSNIESLPGATIYDAETGSALVSGIVFKGGSILKIGGDLLKVQDWNQKKIIVKKASAAKIIDADWGYVSREWTMGDNQPEIVQGYLGLTNLEWPVIRENNQCYLFHFGGRKREIIMKLLAEIAGQDADHIVITNWFLTLPLSHGSLPVDWLKETSAARIRVQLTRNLEGIERRLGRPKVNSNLPPKVRISEIESWLHLEIELESYKKIQIIEDISDETRDVLRALLKTIISPKGKHPTQ